MTASRLWQPIIPALLSLVSRGGSCSPKYASHLIASMICMLQFLSCKVRWIILANCSLRTHIKIEVTDILHSKLTARCRRYTSCAFPSGASAATADDSTDSPAIQETYRHHTEAGSADSSFNAYLRCSTLDTHYDRRFCAQSCSQYRFTVRFVCAIMHAR